MEDDEFIQVLKNVNKDDLLDADVSGCSHSSTYIQDGMTVCNDCCQETCEHIETEEIDGMNVCICCGEEFNEISYEKDWRFYGTSDTKSKKDPSRCHKRKDTSKNIYPYVEGKNFSHSIIANANEKYSQIKDDTHRGKNNKAIITACIYAAYIDEKEPKPAVDIGKIFGLNKKNVSKGIETFYLYYPSYRTQYIEPSDLIRRILIKTNIDMCHYPRVKKLCKYIENSSSAINRSTPQSIACAVVFLYLCMMTELKEELGLTKSKFTSLVNMSDITISKICKHAIEVLNTKEIKI